MGSAASSKTLKTDTQTPAPSPPPPPQLPKDEPNSRISDQSKSTQASASDQSTQPSGDSSNEEKAREGEGEGEEEGECGFCLFMKGGGCKDAFIAWENCVEAVEKDNQDIAEKCFKATAALKECMEAHSDYYEPILRVEKVAEAEVVKELEKQKAEDKEAAASN